MKYLPWRRHPMTSEATFMKISLAIAITFIVFSVSGQSQTTQRLQEKYKDSRAFFFYNNTLRMVNQAEDPAFDEAIRDIEKMKLLLIGKAEDFNFQSIVKEYRAEKFEEIMTSRHKGRNFDIFLKEKDGKTIAMLALINDEKNLFVMDIVGRIDPAKVVSFFSVMDEKSDISGRIKNFVTRNEEAADEGKADDQTDN